MPAAAEPDDSNASGGARWGANYFPNVELVSHEGKRVKFFDDLLKDKVVVINFIYTSCPDVCPLETARLAEVQAILGDRVGRDVFMYSISIDPETDTPEVLADYAKKFGAGPGWTFFTGKADDIVLIRKKLSLYRPEVEGQGSSDHNTTLIIGNQRTGRWMKRSPMENAYFLANQIGGWLHNWKTPSAQQASYADAPELRKITTGENLFRTRCAACHVIGDAADVPASQSARLLGPDLLDVTSRRDRAWLERWLSEPDKMLAEKDPIAIELYARHNKVSMPNFSLNEKDVNALLTYVDTESRRVATAERLKPLVAREKSDAPVSEKFSCCQKEKAAVVSESPSESPSGPPSAPPPATARKSVASLLVSGGVGCLLLWLAFLVRRGGPAIARS